MNARLALKKQKKTKPELSDDDDDDDDEEKNDNESNINRDNNHIYFYSEINRSSILKLNTLIGEAEEYCIITALKLKIECVPIYLHIFSNGGYIYSAFSCIDVIQSCSVPVYSVIEGATASAGTLISVVCKKRFIRPSAYMLIHQLSSGCWGKMAEIEDEYKNLTDFMSKITDIYVKHSKIPLGRLKTLLKHDLWLDSKKSISYGLVDAIY
jgi:ATP-dependent protease ClpP protease subunit